MTSGQRAWDVAIVGGGIIGTSAAAFLAEAGASVLLAECVAIGAGASGRNSGSIQHPFDPVLATLYHRSLELYADVGGVATDDPATQGFRLPAEPAGILLLGTDRRAIEDLVREVAAQAPELSPRLLAGPELHDTEPSLAGDVVACRISTGYPVPPAAATDAYAVRAAQSGALIRLGARAELWIEAGRVHGLVVGEEQIPAGSVLVAAGPQSPEVIAPDRDWRPIVPIWGLNVEVALSDPPRHVVEEVGVESVGQSSDESAFARSGKDELANIPSLFSLITAGSSSTLGSTFLPTEPEPRTLAPELRRRGARFVPSLAEAPIRSTRVCARPQSLDGRPLLGAVPGVDNLFIGAGHGPWGISLGPASAELMVDLILGRRGSVPREVDPARFAARGLSEPD